MAKTHVAPFSDSILEKYSPRLDEKVLNSMHQYIRDIASISVTNVILVNESSEVIAICGVNKLWPGVAELWMMGTDLIPKYKKEFVRHIINGINLYIKQEDIHRLQCTVMIENEPHKAFVEYLGFKGEGPMYRYGPNKEDVIRYARYIE